MEWQLNFNLDYFAVLVSAIAYFLAGSAIFAPPVLGRAWQRASGIDPQQLASKRHPVTAFVGAFLAALVNCFVLAEVLDFTGAQTVPQALGMALFLWSGFFLMGRLPESGFGDGRWKFMVINASYPLVGNVVAAIILTLWPA